MGDPLHERAVSLRARAASLNWPPCTARVWKDAETADDLAESMIGFLRGRLGWCPSHGGPAEEETDDIVEYLVRFNRAGFLTETSQPTDSGDGWEQIAYVAGWARESVARRIERIALRGSLGVVLTAPGTTGGRGRYGDLHPFVEGYPEPSWVEEVWGQCLNQRALRIILTSWHVVAFDTNDRDPMRLWRNLLESLEGPSAGCRRPFDV